MPRIRAIKPQFWLDEKLGILPTGARLLYIGLWNLSDDQGVFEYRPARIKAQLFPYDDTTSQQVADWLKSLEDTGDVIRFAEAGADYGYIPSFAKHQQIKNPSEWAYSQKYPSNTNRGKQYPTPTPALPQQGVTPTPALPIGNREKEKEKESKILPPMVPLLEKGDLFVLPDWIKKDTWSAFKEMRQKTRAHLTERAKALIVSRLSSLRAAGDDPNLVLEQSIMNGWKGVFSLKGGSDGRVRNTARYPRSLPTSYTDPDNL